MFLRHLDLTTALRPSLYDDETLLYVQDGVGLYEGKFKIPNYQNGHAYLTSHRVCYVDNTDPRKYSVAVELKEIDRTEFYAGFLKSSPKVTIFPKFTRQDASGGRGSGPAYASPQDALVGSSSPARAQRSPAPASLQPVNATWICPICAMSNAVPAGFDPVTANQFTKVPPCQTCGTPPPVHLLVKVAITSMSNRTSNVIGSPPSMAMNQFNTTFNGDASASSKYVTCSRCTFRNHASLNACEICGASLQGNSPRVSQLITDSPTRGQSPSPTSTRDTIIGDDTIETIKLSFRTGGGPIFFDRIKNALIQRKWLLQSAPPPPKIPPLSSSTSPNNPSPNPTTRKVGIAALERRGDELRLNNQTVIGTAFSDLEALMTSAKEVIQMAETFARATDTSTDSESRRLLSDSATALGLLPTTTKDILGAPGSSNADQLYLTELARNLAEFLTDDRTGVLRREGGIMSLVDLWQVFNRMRNGIELVSPADFEKAARLWATLNLPIRLRRFKSGLLVVQERSRTDERTVAALVAWLRGAGDEVVFGRGATAQETAERFGWSVGIATEELEMAEELGALCRDQCLDGTRFWENMFVEFATV